MLNKNTYFTCHEIVLNDQQAPESTMLTVVAGVTGKWDHWSGKTFEITQSDLENMVNEFNKSGRDLLFDYDHNSLFGNSVSAGWGKSIRATDKGLEIDIEPTPDGKKAIENKSYRYLSPVYQFSSERKDRKVKLISVALTNTPFLKELPAIINSQKLFENQNEKGANMEKLVKLLSCSEDQVEAKVAELIAINSDQAKKLTEHETLINEQTKQLATQEVEIAVANGLIKQDQKDLALSIRLKDKDLYDQFVNSNKTEKAPQGTLEVPKQADQQTSVISLSQFDNDPQGLAEFAEKHPQKYEELYENLANGGK